MILQFFSTVIFRKPKLPLSYTPPHSNIPVTLPMLPLVGLTESVMSKFLDYEGEDEEEMMARFESRCQHETGSESNIGDEENIFSELEAKADGMWRSEYQLNNTFMS